MPVGSDDPTLPVRIIRPDQLFQKVCNGHLVISSIFKGVPRVSSQPFEPLDISGHPMSWENTSTTWDQAIQQEINPLQECKCARVLGPTEWWSSEGLEPVTLVVWRHLAGLGGWSLLVSSWSLLEPKKKKLYTVWSKPFRRWRKGILSGYLIFMMQGSDTLCGCSNVD